MYVLFASCAFIAKSGGMPDKLEVAEPIASINPEDISWGCSGDSLGEYWYAEGMRCGECFSVEPSPNVNDIYFFDPANKSECSDCASYTVSDMHLYCSNEEGRNYDLIFLNEMTAYDCLTGTYYQRADYDSLKDQLVDNVFVNSTNSRDFYTFKDNGKSAEHFGDQIFKGNWTLDTTETLSVYDKECKEYFHFNLLFDDCGLIKGFMFNDVEYTLAA